MHAILIIVHSIFSALELKTPYIIYKLSTIKYGAIVPETFFLKNMEAEKAPNGAGWKYIFCFRWNHHPSEGNQSFQNKTS